MISPTFSYDFLMYLFRLYKTGSLYHGYAYGCQAFYKKFFDSYPHSWTRKDTTSPGCTRRAL